VIRLSIELLIQNGSTIYYPVVEEGVSLTWERKGTPGKLEFTVIKDGVLNFQEGNPVKLTVNGTTMFYCSIFTKYWAGLPMPNLLGTPILK